MAGADWLALIMALTMALIIDDSFLRPNEDRTIEVKSGN